MGACRRRGSFEKGKRERELRKIRGKEIGMIFQSFLWQYFLSWDFLNGLKRVSANVRFLFGGKTPLFAGPKTSGHTFVP